MTPVVTAVAEQALFEQEVTVTTVEESLLVVAVEVVKAVEVPVVVEPVAVVEEPEIEAVPVVEEEEVLLVGLMISPFGVVTVNEMS